MALIHPNPSSPAIIPCPCHPPWPVPGLPVSGRNSEGLGPPGLRSDQARRSLALEKYEGRMGGRKSMYQIASGKLWQTYKKLWKITIYSEFSHEKWWFSIVFCMFTRPGISKFDGDRGDASVHNGAQKMTCRMTKQQQIPNKTAFLWSLYWS